MSSTSRRRKQTSRADAFAPGSSSRESIFFAAAERINEILRAGAVPPHDRARLLAAVLLAGPENSGPNPVREINARLSDLSAGRGNGALLKRLRIASPPNAAARRKLTGVLIALNGELEKLSAHSDGGDDALGRFHEVFLKYANPARDLGIVLTPPHITRFAAKILDTGPGDHVFDPACGTGGFLTAALEMMRPGKGRVFGLEQEPGIACLALTNMLLRGQRGDCISQGDLFAKPAGKRAASFTKVLMNPPFAMKGRSELLFLERALEYLKEGGLLFAILPYAALVRPGLDKTHRRELLLRENTLLAVLTLPEELFHPVGVPAAAVVLRKGRGDGGESPGRQRGVLWARMESDGLRITRGRRLPGPGQENQLDDLRDTLREFIRRPDAKIAARHRFLKVAPPDEGDALLELVPEAYLRDTRPEPGELTRAAELSVRESLAAMVKAGRAVFKMEIAHGPGRKRVPGKTKWKSFRVDEIVDIAPGDFHSLNELEPGPWPVISRAAQDNGLAGWFEKPPGASLRRAGTITVSTVTGDAFTHFMPYLATDNVLVCEPRTSLKPSTLFFIQLMINRNRWRYSYGRQCYLAKFRRTMLILPVTDAGRLNTGWMERIIASAGYWPQVRAVFAANMDADSREGK